MGDEGESSILLGRPVCFPNPARPDVSNDPGLSIGVAQWSEAELEREPRAEPSVKAGELDDRSRGTGRSLLPTTRSTISDPSGTSHPTGPSPIGGPPRILVDRGLVRFVSRITLSAREGKRDL